MTTMELKLYVTVRIFQVTFERGNGNVAIVQMI